MCAVTNQMADQSNESLDRVFGALADPTRRAILSRVDVEPVPGGRYDVTMCHSAGNEVRRVGCYGEVVPSKRLSYTLTWLGDLEGEGESLVTVEFRAVPEG